MPAGVVLDHYYKVAADDGYLGYFFNLRVACSFLAAIVWLLFSTPFGGKHYRLSRAADPLATSGIYLLDDPGDRGG